MRERVLRLFQWTFSATLFWLVLGWRVLDAFSSWGDITELMSRTSVFLNEYPLAEVVLLFVLFAAVIVGPDAKQWIATKIPKTTASRVADLESTVAQQRSELVAIDQSMGEILMGIVSTLDRAAEDLEFKFELLLLKDEFVGLYAAYCEFRTNHGQHPAVTAPLSRWWVAEDTPVEIQKWKVDLQAYVRHAKTFGDRWRCASLVYDHRLFQSISDWDQSDETPAGLEFEKWLQSYGVHLLEGIKERENIFRAKLDGIKAQIQHRANPK
jgi:hypothetical protein